MTTPDYAIRPLTRMNARFLAFRCHQLTLPEYGGRQTPLPPRQHRDTGLRGPFC